MEIKTVLFLCTGNYYRSRFAEEYFNHLAKINSLEWRAISRGIAAEITKLRNPGPISTHALFELKARNISPQNAAEYPRKASYNDLRNAVFIIALSRNEHQKMLRDNYPELNRIVDFWEIEDVEFEQPQSACLQIANKIDRLITILK